MYAGVPRALPSVSSSPSLRPSSSVRDVLWERALSGLQDQLLSALRAAELDEPVVLFEYPRMTVEELKGTMGELLGDHVAPSGATFSSQPTTSSLNSTTAATLTSRVATRMVGSDTVGGVPKTGHVSFPIETGGDPRTDHASFSGGDPKTDRASLVRDKGGDPKTDHASLATTDTGGDPKTVHSLGKGGISPQSGGLATQTATPDSPACTDSAVSRAECPEVADGFTMTKFPAVRDGFPCISEGCESRDEFLRSGVIGQLETESMNSSPNNTDTVFSRVLHDDEKSEGVRQSDFRVQNLPASGSSSELSAHQMGASLAGTSRLKTDAIDPERLDRSSNTGCFDG